MEGSSHKFKEVGPEDIGLDRSRIEDDGAVELLAEKPLPGVPDQAAQGKHLQSGDPQSKIQSQHGNQAPDAYPGRSATDEHEKPSKREAFKEKVKGALHIGSSNTDGPKGNTGNAPVLADADDTVSGERYTQERPQPEHHTAKDLLKNPVDTITSKVAGTGGHHVSANIAAKEVSHGQDVQLVRAHDALMRSRNETERMLAVNDINNLLQMRQKQMVRWTMDRHVQKVRILPPHAVPWKGKEHFTHIRNGKKEVDWLAWAEHMAKYYAYDYAGEYIGYTASPPQPSKEVIMPAVERLLVASAPFQELIMTMRKIYRWDDPSTTSKYLAGFAVAWAFNQVLPAGILGMVYLIANRKMHEPTLNELRKDIIRTEDRNKTALTVTEFIEKEGDEGWVDELVRVIGPWLMIQLADLANLMEIMRNFYEWRVPSRTLVTIVIMAISAIAIAVTPAWLMLRMVTFGMGAAFFGLFPIASRYPDYRLLASPIRWLFWKIPTHAEWAVQNLQAQGARYNETHNSGPSGPQGGTQRLEGNHMRGNDTAVSSGMERPKTHDPLGYRGPPTKLNEVGEPVYIHDGTAVQQTAGSGTQGQKQYSAQGATALPDKSPAQQNAENTKVLDYGSYNCKWNDHSGQLVLTSHGIRFEHSGKTQWEVAYEKLGRLEKVTRQVADKLSRDSSNSGQDLTITTTSPFAGGEESKFDEAKGEGQEVRESLDANAKKQGGGATGGMRSKESGEGKSESTAGKNMMQQVEKKEERGEKGEDFFVLNSVQGRDQAFSQIVGFSHVKWVVIW